MIPTFIWTTFASIVLVGAFVACALVVVVGVRLLEKFIARRRPAPRA